MTDSQTSKRTRARVLALYLPQFHPTPENDEWWGPGFTEWINVARARPLFRGHYQPNLPGELGFYDLRLPETREHQAQLAREHGVEGFCYWHYWMAGRRLLERPLREVIQSGRPEFPFAIGWANHSWTGVWIGATDRILAEQSYPGESDYEAHFLELLPAFRDQRYVRVEGRLLFLLFRPRDIPDPLGFTRLWRRLAGEHAVGDFHFVATGSPDLDLESLGMDAVVSAWVPERRQPVWRRVARRLLPTWRERLTVPSVYSYEWYSRRVVPQSLGRRPHGWQHALLVPNWDNTPRSGREGVVLEGSTPELFRRQVAAVLAQFEAQGTQREERIVFLKSWNEWAEGNYMEPDRRWGRAYLEALREELLRSTE